MAGTKGTQPNTPDAPSLKAEPETDKDGALTQAYTDEATGQTYMPGEKVGDDVE